MSIGLNRIAQILIIAALFVGLAAGFLVSNQITLGKTETIYRTSQITTTQKIIENSTVTSTVVTTTAITTTAITTTTITTTIVNNSFFKSQVLVSDLNVTVPPAENGYPEAVYSFTSPIEIAAQYAGFVQINATTNSSNISMGLNYTSQKYEDLVGESIFQNVPVSFAIPTDDNISIIVWNPYPENTHNASIVLSATFFYYEYFGPIT